MTKKRVKKSSPVKSRDKRNFKKESYAVDAKVLNEILYESHNEVYLFDTGSLRFIFANKVALENLGYTLGEIRRFTPVHIHAGFTTSSFRRLVDTLLVQQKERLSFESKLKRKDGTHYTAEVNLLLSGPEGKKVFVAILNDISDRKRTNETLHQLQKAVETGREGIAIADAKITGLYRD
jgi:PAS domain S-box-containing protein